MKTNIKIKPTWLIQTARGTYVCISKKQNPAREMGDYYSRNKSFAEPFKTKKSAEEFIGFWEHVQQGSVMAPFFNGLKVVKA